MEVVVSSVVMPALVMVHRLRVSMADAVSTHSSSLSQVVVSEPDALRNSGWTMWVDPVTPNYCNWVDITCNGAGHVLEKMDLSIRN